jgi:glycosyltransferase involved in cell wall biosynthesis
VRVLHHPRNLGYGAALRTGFQSASKELVFYTDCDEPVDLADIERALSLMTPDVDLVVGYRADRHDTPRRWLYSLVYNALMRVMFDVRARDVNFSFKLARRTVLQHVSLQARSTFIDGELLAEAVRHGYRVVEMPVEYHPRMAGRSSFDGLDAALHALAEMLSYFWRTRLRVSSLLSKVQQ